MNEKVLITLLSWEERYLLGLKNTINSDDPNLVIVLKFDSYSEWKNENLKLTSELLSQKNLLIVDIDVSNPVKIWTELKRVFTEHCLEKDVIIDISTMTREVIWYSLYNCKVNNNNVKYVYNTPKEYPCEWVSRDPDRPRLLYKMSGISKLGVPSLLMVTGGYDLQRIDNLIFNFEPRDTIIFFQEGNDKRNTEALENAKSLVKSKYGVETILQYNAFNVDESYGQIKNILIQNIDDRSYIESHNVIFNSLGPKLSAITLFKLWLEFPHVALSYIPSKEYNHNYSKGIGSTYIGTFNFSE